MTFLILMALCFNLSAKPTVSTWQCKLTDISGNAITQINIDMTFAKIDASAGGNSNWPASAGEGDIHYDINTQKLCCYERSA